MRRIGTHNVNGIRAALRRGFAPWWAQTNADIIALQEVRCRADDLPLEAFAGYHATLDTGTLAREAHLLGPSLTGMLVRMEAAGLVQRKSLLGQGQQILMAVLYVARAQLSLRSVRECGQRACVD